MLLSKKNDSVTYRMGDHQSCEESNLPFEGLLAAIRSRPQQMMTIYGDECPLCPIDQPCSSHLGLSCPASRSPNPAAAAMCWTTITVIHYGIIR